MPSPSVDLGSGWSLSMTGLTLEAVSARWTGIERANQDTTHLGTGAAPANNFGNRTFLAGKMVDPGRIEGVFHFNPDDTPIIGGAPTAVTVTWPSSGGATQADWVAQGFMQSFDVDGIGIDEKMVANIVIKLTGNVAITAAT